MKGDFSRIPYDASANITRVLFQQGKPLVEADLNEALLALLENERRLWRRVIALPSAEKSLELTAKAVGNEMRQLEVSAGTARLNDLEFTNRRPLLAQGYVSNGTEFIADFAKPAKGKTGIASGSFVVGLAATEREMLRSDIAGRSPQTSDLRSSVPWSIQWAIILVPYDPNGGNTAVEAASTSINNRTSGVGALPDIRVTTAPPAELLNEPAGSRLISDCLKDRDNPESYDCRLLRLEAHGLDDDGTRLIMKLAIDNASDVFEVESSDATSVHLRPHRGALPAKGHYIEAETRFQWLSAKPAALHPITLPAETRDGIFVKNALAKNTVGDVAQVRQWHCTTTVAAADLVNGFRIGPLKISLDYADATDVLKVVQRGDGWTFRTSQVADKIENAEYLPGTRQPVYYSALRIARFNEQGSLLEVNPLPPPAGALNGSEHLEQLVASRPAIRDAATHPLSSDVAKSLSCHRLFPDIQNRAAKRWLASATLGEIAGLSKEQLRQRIERDSQPQELDPPTLDRDLNAIFARRQQLLLTDTLA